MPRADEGPQGQLGEATFRRILVAFDGSESSWKALRKAVFLARALGAVVVALSVEEHLPRYAATVGEMEEEKQRENGYFAGIQGQAVGYARSQGIELETRILAGHAAQSIVNFARDQGFDLIAIGHSGHSGLWGVLLGSTAARVVDQAHCDVLVVR